MFYILCTAKQTTNKTKHTRSESLSNGFHREVSLVRSLLPRADFFLIRRRCPLLKTQTKKSSWMYGDEGRKEAQQNSSEEKEK